MKNNFEIEKDRVLERYQFENYITGTNNSNLIEQLKNSNSANTSCNSRMFLVFGTTGVGKTHLAQAYFNYIRKQQNSNPYYSSAASFSRAFVEAVVNNERNTFVNEFKQYTALILDDIHVLANKEKTQEVLIEILEQFLSASKPVLITFTEGYLKETSFDVKLISLIKSGIIHKLRKPDYDLRLKYLKKQARNLNVSIEEHLLGVIAHDCKKGDVRTLNGILSSLSASQAKEISYRQLKATMKLYNF